MLKAGKGRDTRPDRGQIVMLRMAGRLDDGTAVDWKLSTEFILGEGEVIQGGWSILYWLFTAVLWPRFERPTPSG